jgi:hypothetical protein
MKPIEPNDAPWWRCCAFAPRPACCGRACMDVEPCQAPLSHPMLHPPPPHPVFLHPAEEAQRRRCLVAVRALARWQVRGPAPAGEGQAPGCNHGLGGCRHARGQHGGRAGCQRRAGAPHRPCLCPCPCPWAPAVRGRWPFRAAGLAPRDGAAARRPAPRARCPAQLGLRPGEHRAPTTAGAAKEARSEVHASANRSLAMELPPSIQLAHGPVALLPPGPKGATPGC